MFSYLATIVLAATSALTLPGLFPRDEDFCAQFGGGAFGTGGPFTLVVSVDPLTSGGDLLVLSPPVGVGASGFRPVVPNLTGGAGPVF